MALFKKKMKIVPGLVPYMDPVELSQMLAIIEATAPRRVLEWGSGGSTKLLLERCPFIERFVSIEHDREWHARMSALVQDPRLALHLVEPVRPAPADKKAYLAWVDEAELDRSNFERYITFPGTLGERFDFVLVDGRARSFCITAGWELLDPGGVMVIHDSQRKVYHPSVHRLGARPVWLEPFYNGQICLIRKPRA